MKSFIALAVIIATIELASAFMEKQVDEASGPCVLKDKLSVAMKTLSYLTDDKVAGPGHIIYSLLYWVNLVVVDLCWVDLNSGVPLSAQFCLGRLELDRIAWAAGQEGGRTFKSKSTQPRPPDSHCIYVKIPIRLILANRIGISPQRVFKKSFALMFKVTYNYRTTTTKPCSPSPWDT